NEKAVVEDRVLDEVLVALGEPVLAEADLDSEFPVARWADKFGVSRILNKESCRSAQPLVAKVVPEQGVRIEQDPHSMYSSNPWRCSSSSDTTISLPRPRPKTGRGWSADWATNLATGRALRVRTISSPGASRSTSSGSAAWASSMVMVGMGLLR